jgi:hypothetical protein
MEDEELTQKQRHLRQINGVSNSPALVAVVQHEETTGATVLLLNNQVLNDGDQVDYNGKQFPVSFAIENLGTVPDVPNMEAPWQFISVDRWDPIAKTIVSYTTPYWGPGIPAHPVVDQSGNVIKGAEVPAIPATEGTPEIPAVPATNDTPEVPAIPATEGTAEVPATYEYPQVPAIPSTMRPGSTVVGAVVHLTIGGIPIAPDNKGLGSHVLCEDLALDRFAFTVPNTVWGFNAPKHGKRPADD